MVKVKKHYPSMDKKYPRIGNGKLTQVERWRHKNVFETYLLLGPARTLRALHEATEIPLSTLMWWNKCFKWEERVYSRDQKAMMAIEKENDIILKETIMKRHQQAYQEVQEKALDYMEKNPSCFRDMKDAAIALDIGVHGERKVLGLTDTKIKAGIMKEGLAAMIEMVMKE